MTRLLLGCMLVAGAALSEDLSVLQGTVDGAPAQAMMKRYLQGFADDAFAERAARFEAIKTPEDVAAYQARLRSLFIEHLGGFSERTPLNARTVGTLPGDGYQIEKVIFESRPGHFVTATLYLPDAPKPVPGVIVPCGHDNDGKAGQTYQRASILLAMNGIAALCYDPTGQGERFHYFKADGAPEFGTTVHHSLMGVGAILTGTNIAQYRIWDGIRALDYLESRPEIDAQRLGCTGNSGGGTLTSQIMAVDPRVRVAAPSCYITSYPRLLDTIGPQDAEQHVYGQIAFGMDHADYIHLRAPQPTLLCAATQDFFDITGTWDSFREAKRLYGRLGVPEHVDLVETDATHGFSQPLREGMVRWMLRWLEGVEKRVQEPELTLRSPEELWCAPGGKTAALEGSLTPLDLHLELAEAAAPARQALWQGDPDAALEKVRALTGMRSQAEMAVPSAEEAGALARDRYRILKRVLRPEPGIALPALHFVPADAAESVVLYVNDTGVAMDAGPGGPIEQLVQRGKEVLAVDLRGFGETAAADYPTGAWTYVGKDWPDASRAYLLAKSYVGLRADDILACVNHLRANGERPLEIVATGQATLPALHAAAAMREQLAHLTLRRGIPSWQAVLEDPRASEQWTSAVHGALLHYDLPDLLGVLGADKVTLEDMGVPTF